MDPEVLSSVVVQSLQCTRKTAGCFSHSAPW
jgi:hypothetical protein